MRLISHFPLNFLISVAPAETPSKSAVHPRGSIALIRAMSASFSATYCAGTITSLLLSYATTLTMSFASSRLIASHAASLALTILSPLIEPERSRTMARFTDGRLAAATLSAASVTFTYASPALSASRTE